MKIKPLVISAMLVAVSFIGANIKLMNTVAFDSMPGFFASIFLGPVYGAVIAAMGHFFTAMLSGFPLSLPVHILIMLDMAVTMLIFGNIYSKLIKKGYDFMPYPSLFYIFYTKNNFILNFLPLSASY